MVNGINPALSALLAFGQKLGVIANNVANVNTEGFKKSRADLEESFPSGVSVSISRIDTPGSPLPFEGDDSKIHESSNVALDEEMVDLLVTKNGYEANLKSVEAQGDLLGTLLDVLD